MSFDEVLSKSPVIPVITPLDVDSTVKVAEALLAGGISSIEITLRNDKALSCINAVKTIFPEMTVAAGTLVNAEDIYSACDAGADFFVSPGISAAVIEAGQRMDRPLLPGVATSSDIMLGISAELSTFKFFPAVAAGGIGMLKALAGPFPDVKFCPTGGLSEDNYCDFLALPNVICCGGSWMVTQELIRSSAWSTISGICRKIATQGR